MLVGGVRSEILLIGNSLKIVPLEFVSKEAFRLEGEIVHIIGRSRKSEQGIEGMSTAFAGIHGSIFRAPLAGITLVAVSVSALAFYPVWKIARPELIVMSLIYHQGILALDGKAFHRTQCHLHHVVLGDHLPLVGHHVDVRDRSIDGIAVLIQRIVPVIRTNDRRQVDGAVPEGGSADIGLVQVPVLERVGHFQGYIEPLGEVVTDIETACHLADSAGFDDTLGIVP